MRCCQLDTSLDICILYTMIVLGIGTGRCGTQSLARLINGCKMTACEHEMPDNLPWKFDRELYEKRARELSRGTLTHVAYGDVGSYYLNYVSRFIKDFPDKQE